MNTVIQIAGMSYSGSSLLNILLGTQPDIYALGECCHIYSPRKPIQLKCSKCGVLIEKCSFFQGINTSNFYSECFKRSGSRVIVDSSKTKRMGQVLDDSFEYLIIFLSKSPHEYIHSYIGHRAEGSCEEAMKEYIHIHNSLLRFYEELRSKYSLRYEYLTYRKLAQDTFDTIKHICFLCNATFDYYALLDWQNMKCHFVGGNIAVKSQVANKTDFFSQETKYKGKFGKIFFDDAWHKDSEFINECHRLYGLYIEKLDPILLKIGQPNVAMQLKDLNKNTIWSGRLDSNQRPPAPKAGTLAN